MQRSSSAGAVRRALVQGLRRLERLAAVARRRLDPSDVEQDPQLQPSADSYGRLWDPGAETDAMDLIFTTSDTETFETAGKADAERLSAFFGPSSTVLDLGCGIGRVARYVAPGCATLWAVDASERMLELAANRLHGLTNVRYARCVDTSLPAVPTASVDLAYAFLVLQHLEREDAFLLLEELRRVIAPTGRAVLTFPNLLSETYLQGFLDYAHGGEVANRARARIYTPQEVERILPAAGFDVVVDANVEIFAVCRPG